MVDRTLLYSVLAGALFAAAFEPAGLWWAAPLAYLLFFTSLARSRYPEIVSLLFGTTSALIVLSWSKTFVGVTPWLLLALLQGLYLLPLGFLSRFTKSIPVFIFYIVLIEEVKARFPFGGFSWMRIAFSQVESPFVSALPYVGMAGLSLLTLTLVPLIVSQSRIGAASLLFILIASSAVADIPVPKTSISVRAVQGGVPERGLNFNARAQAVLDNHIDTTRKFWRSGDELLVWPENSIDVDPSSNELAAEKISSLIKDIKTPLIAGAIIEPDRLYNATLMFDEDGHIQSTYIKRYLTPFGEYIPLRGIATAISSHASQVSDFSPGEYLEVHQVKSVLIGSVICYEILNDGLLREAANGSGFLVIHTNSATFAGSSEGEQQLAITRLRSIELRREIVSVSTTGPSAIIDAGGVVLQKLNDGEVGTLSADIGAQDSKTFSLRYGGWLTIAVLLFSLMWALISIRREQLR